jgi:hypothetical protein
MLIISTNQKELVQIHRGEVTLHSPNKLQISELVEDSSHSVARTEKNASFDAHLGCSFREVECIGFIRYLRRPITIQKMVGKDVTARRIAQRIRASASTSAR